jgi:hypothetical protein
MSAFRLLIPLVLITGSAQGQNDTIVSRDGNMLVGEIKSLEKGVLFLETSYSDKDFNIEWDKVSEVRSDRTFLIYLSDGRRLNGSVHSSPGGDPGFVVISGAFGNLIIDELLMIFYMKPVERSFIGKLDASIELGYSYTKTQNHHQFNSRSNLGYFAETWGADASFNINRSRQDSVATTRRTEGTVGARLFLRKSWFLALSNNFLQSDEQKLELRSTTNFLTGHFLINTYKTYWGVGVGFAYNNERFQTDDPDVQSGEGLLSSELNLFAHENLSLLTAIKVYPGITVKGRIRSDFKFDLKYDLPLDFFIKLGFSHNYDNKPVEGASRQDYVIQTTFGWEL